MQSICAPCHRHKGSKTSFGKIVQLAKARRVDTVARLLSQLCPHKSILGANHGLKNVGLENMAINSTHFQWPDLDDFCATVFATTPSRFEVSGTRLNTGDSFKWKQRLENKSTSQSPIGATIPRWFSAKHEAGEVVEPYSQACLDGDWEQIHLDWTFSVVATPSRSASLFRSQFCSYMQRTSASTAYFSSKVTNNGD